jgi:membrane AbrB-like protein
VLVAAAQVVVGSALGCRFTGVRVERIGRCAAMSLGLTALMLGVAVAASWLLNAATGLGMAGLILAFAPGGLAEMSLIALALGTDIAFVSTHHIVRIVLIVTLAPGMFLLWRRWRGR